MLNQIADLVESLKKKFQNIDPRALYFMFNTDDQLLIANN